MGIKWAEVEAKPEFQALTDSEKLLAQNEFFDDQIASQVPEEERGPARREFLIQYGRAIPDTGQSRMGANIAKAGQEFANVGASTVGGVGEFSEGFVRNMNPVGWAAMAGVPGAQEAVDFAVTPGQFLRQTAAPAMKEGIKTLTPINPLYANAPEQEAAGVIGQAAGQMVSLLVPAKLASLTPKVATALGLTQAGAMGMSAGGEAADQYGVTDPNTRSLMAMLYGGVEAGSESIGGFGTQKYTRQLLGDMKSFLTGKGALKRFGKTAVGEGLEEVPAGAGQDALVNIFAEEDPNRPGYSKTGYELPNPLDIGQRAKEFGYGTLAGAMFGGAQLIGSKATVGQALAYRSEAQKQIQQLQSRTDLSEAEQAELTDLQAQDKNITDWLGIQGAKKALTVAQEVAPDEPLVQEFQSLIQAADDVQDSDLEEEQKAEAVRAITQQILSHPVNELNPLNETRQGEILNPPPTPEQEIVSEVAAQAEASGAPQTAQVLQSIASEQTPEIPDVEIIPPTNASAPSTEIPQQPTPTAPPVAGETASGATADQSPVPKPQLNRPRKVRLAVKATPQQVQKAAAKLGKLGRIRVATKAELQSDPAFRAYYERQVGPVTDEEWVGLFETGLFSTAEGLASDGAGAALIIPENVAIYDDDVRRGKALGVSPVEAAVIRLGLHENWHGVEHWLETDTKASDLKARYDKILSEIPEEQLDDLAARRYQNLSNWRTNERSKRELQSEVMAERREAARLTGEPDNLVDRFMAFLRDLFRAITGSNTEPTPDELESIFQAWHAAQKQAVGGGVQASRPDNPMPPDSRLEAAGPMRFSRAENGTVAGPGNFRIKAYHGTPHKVDKFTTAKIGTGEGAQAYGYGLYFAEDKGVGEYYVKSLSPLEETVNGQPFDPFNVEHYAAKALFDAGMDATKAIAKIDENIRRFSRMSEDYRASVPNYISELEASKALIAKGNVPEFKSQNTGNLYTVELLASEDELLDWDSPLSQQSEKVQNAVLRGYREMGIPAPSETKNPNKTGEWVYKDFVAGMGGQQAMDASEASKYLSDLGIKGIKFLDGNSRSKGAGSRNFVVFNDADIRITERNGQPVPLDEAMSEQGLRASRPETVKAMTPMFHGTKGKMREIGPDDVLYMTTSKGDASSFADGLIPGTVRGQAGKPAVLEFLPPDDGSAVDITEEIEEALMDGDVDSTVKEAFKREKAAGTHSWLTFEHPSAITDESFPVYIPLYPDELLTDEDGSMRFSRPENTGYSPKSAPADVVRKDSDTGTVGEMSLWEDGSSYGVPGRVYWFNRLLSREEGKGGGSKVLAQLQEMSDKTQVPILNTVSDYGRGDEGLEKNIQWYLKRGFERVPGQGETTLIYRPKFQGQTVDGQPMDYSNAEHRAAMQLAFADGNREEAISNLEWQIGKRAKELENVISQPGASDEQVASRVQDLDGMREDVAVLRKGTKLGAWDDTDAPRGKYGKSFPATSEQGLRASRPEVLDKKYSKAVRDDDALSQQSIMDEAARQKGWEPRDMYHYGASNITEFRTDVGDPADQGPAGLYLSPDEDRFEGFQMRGGGKYRLYLRIQNPATLETHLTRRMIQEAERAMGPRKKTFVNGKSEDGWDAYLNALRKQRENIALDLAEYGGDPESDAIMQARIRDIDRVLDWKKQPLDQELPIPLLAFLDRAYYGKDIMIRNGQTSLRWNGEGGMSLDEKRDLKRKARSYLESLGFDGVEKLGQAPFWSVPLTIYGATPDFGEVVAFRPNQIKSAEPVVRDESGEIIPPSKRFDQSSQNIRFSRPEIQQALQSEIRRITGFEGEFRPSNLRGFGYDSDTDRIDFPTDADPEALISFVSHEATHAVLERLRQSDAEAYNTLLVGVIDIPLDERVEMMRETGLFDEQDESQLRYAAGEGDTQDSAEEFLANLAVGEITGRMDASQFPPGIRGIIQRITTAIRDAFKALTNPKHKAIRESVAKLIDDAPTLPKAKKTEAQAKARAKRPEGAPVISLPPGVQASQPELSRTEQEKKQWEEDLNEVSPDLKQFAQVLGKRSDTEYLVQAIKPMVEFARAKINAGLAPFWTDGEKPEYADTDRPPVTPENTQNAWRLATALLDKSNPLAPEYIKEFRSVMSPKGSDYIHNGDAAAAVLQLELIDYGVRLAATANLEGKAPGTQAYRDEVQKLDLAIMLIDGANDAVMNEYGTVAGAGRLLNVRGRAQKSGFWTTMKAIKKASQLAAEATAGSPNVLKTLTESQTARETVEDAINNLNKSSSFGAVKDLVSAADANLQRQAESAQEDSWWEKAREILGQDERRLLDILESDLRELVEVERLLGNFAQSTADGLQASQPESLDSIRNDREALQKRKEALQKRIKTTLESLTNKETALDPEQRKKVTKRVRKVLGPKSEAEAILKRYEAKPKAAKKDPSPLKKAFTEQIKNPKSVEDFEEAMRPFGLSEETVDRMFDAAALAKSRADALKQSSKRKTKGPPKAFSEWVGGESQDSIEDFVDLVAKNVTPSGFDVDAFEAALRNKFASVDDEFIKETTARVQKILDEVNPPRATEKDWDAAAKRMVSSAIARAADKTVAQAVANPMQAAIKARLKGEITSEELQDRLKALKVESETALAVSRQTEEDIQTRKDAKDKAKQEREVERRLKEQQRIKNRPDKLAQAEIDKFDEAQTEMLKDEKASKERVLEIRDEALNDVRADDIHPRHITQAQFVAKYSALLQAAGVSTPKAEALARRLYDGNRRMRGNRFIKKRDAFANSTAFVNGLVEKILNAPPALQNNREWRRQTFIEAFESRGLTTAQATAAADALSLALEKAWKTAKAKAAQKAAEKLGMKKLTVDAIMKAINADAFNPDDPITQALAEKAGFKSISAKDFQRLAWLGNQIANPDSSPTERGLWQAEMLAILKKAKMPKGLLETITRGFENSALSGTSNIMINYTSVPFTLARRLLVDMLDIASGKGSAAQKAATMGHAVLAMQSTVSKRFANEVKNSWKNDAYSRKLNEHIAEEYSMRQELRKNLDILQSDKSSAAQKAAALVKVIYNSTDLVRRVLSAADQAWGASIDQYFFRSQAFREMLTTLNMSPKEGRVAVEDAMNTAKEKADQRVAELAKEGQNLSPATIALIQQDYYNQALREFLNGKKEGLGDQLVAGSEKEGNLEIGTVDASEKPAMWDVPQHVFDIAKKMSSGARQHSQLLGRILTGFITVPANIVNRSLYFTPWGLGRVWAKSTSKQREELYTEYMETSQAKRLRTIEGIVGTLGIIAGMMLNGDDDDKDEFGIQITGQGPKNPSLREAWLKDHKQNAIEITMGGKRVSIPYGRGGFEGVSIPMAAAAAMDDLRLNKTDKKNVGLFGRWLGQTVAAFSEQARFLGIRNYAQVLSAPSATQAAKTAAFTTSGFIPFSGFMKSVGRIASGQADQSSVESAILANYPIANLFTDRKLNYFGDATGKDDMLSRFWFAGLPVGVDSPEDTPNADIYRMLLSKGFAPAFPSRTLLEGKNGPLSDDKWASYVKARGRRIKAGIRESMSELKAADSREFDNLMDKITSDSTKAAKEATGLK